MKWNFFMSKTSGSHAGKESEWVFRTNIMCNGCVAKIKPVLDNADGIASWRVDLENPHRLLTVVPNGITEERLIELVRGAGFEIERW